MPVHRIQQPSRWLPSRLDSIDQLSVLSGLPRTSIRHAIPQWEKQPGNFPQGPLAATPRWACRRCVARRTGNPDERVKIWMSNYHDQVCIPHRLWIGRAVETPSNQFDLAGLPEVVGAQRRHYRLLRHYGPNVLNPCYVQCSGLWHALLRHGYLLDDRTHRLARLRPRSSRTVRPWDSERYAAVYPEIVQTMVLYASPRWRGLRHPATRRTSVPSILSSSDGFPSRCLCAQRPNPGSSTSSASSHAPSKTPQNTPPEATRPTALRPVARVERGRAPKGENPMTSNTTLA